MMKLISSIFMMVISSIALAQVEPVNKDGLAIGGYDVVAYFETGKPEKGSGNFKSMYEGAVYYFASAERQKLFDANPVQ
jgi:hypothetical protein